MSFGGARHAADIRADDMSAEGQSVIGLQAGSNKGATQSGRLRRLSHCLSHRLKSLKNGGLKYSVIFDGLGASKNRYSFAHLAYCHAFAATTLQNVCRRLS